MLFERALIMAATANTAVSLSESYYLRSFYKSNRDAATASKRGEISQGKLSEADAEALRTAVRKLRNFDMEDDTDDGANIYASVSAFLKTYNNAMESAGSSKDYSLQRYAKQLKNLAKEYTDELEDIGVTVKSDGTLEKNDNLLKSADVSDIKKLFGEDAKFATKSSNYAKRMNEKAADLIYTELTQKGQIINLSL